MILRRFIFFFVYLLLTFSGYSQMSKIIDSIEIIEKKCLDSGIKMKNCSYVFYNKMDSLLNVQYNKQKNILSENKKVKLKLEQINWLSTRNDYFKRLENEYSTKLKTGEWGRDDIMIVWDKKAEFVKKRILAILYEYNYDRHI